MFLSQEATVAISEVTMAGSTAEGEMSQFKTCSMVYKAPQRGLKREAGVVELLA